MRNEKAMLVKLISENSNSRGDLILKFLGEYHLIGLIEANTKQLREFCRNEKLL